MVPIAIGTQTTGSTIRPASFCGVFGYRPTYGEHRMHGVMEASGSLDTLGILARSLEDIALYRDVLLGISPEPIADLDRPPRIGIWRSHVWKEIEPTTRKLVEDAADRLARAGAAVSEFELPADFAQLHDAHRSISSFEFARTFTWEIENHWDEISDTLRSGRLADGLSCSFEQYIAAKTFADACRRQLDDMWGEHDVLLTPAAFGEATVGTFAFVGVPLYQLWTILHVPALSLPVFKGPNNLPIGAQLLAKRHDDRRLFACARWVYGKLS
jgi:Asp-tRNA(Asn)/Glu-tRNA(Gln) amidotransferase A subunit family amidase